LHLMRTGAAGVLVGFGGGASHTTSDVIGVRVPMATAVAEVAAARRDYLDESGGRYVHVIADGSMGTSGDVVKAFACGADAAMVGSIFARASDAPGRGAHWGAEAWHPTLPRGERQLMEQVGTFAEVLHGPSYHADGTANIVGALRKAMATTGYSDLKEFIHELDVPVIVGGCSTRQAALHLMRTGAAGVLVGFGGGASHTTSDVIGVRVPMATAVAEVAAARRDYLDESGGRYVHVIADGSMGTSGDVVKAFACGADAAMVGSIFARASDAPGRGAHWGAEAWHPSLPRGERQLMEQVGTFAEVLHGPSYHADGTANIVGALRKAMATTGYSDLKEFQRVDMVITS